MEKKKSIYAGLSNSISHSIHAILPTHGSAAQNKAGRESTDSTIYIRESDTRKTKKKEANKSKREEQNLWRLKELDIMVFEKSVRPPVSKDNRKSDNLSSQSRPERYLQASNRYVTSNVRSQHKV
jgi:hypothetical protein